MKIKKEIVMKELFKILSILSIVFFVSCSDYVDYEKDHTNGEEIRYAGKANDPAYFAGHNRIEVKYVLGPDPNINKSVIYWNLRADSITVSINRAELANDTITRIIEGLPENTYSFEIYNYDKFGNKSVPTYLTAKSYGNKYIANLYDRNVTSYEAASLGGDLKINWGDSVMKSVGVRVEYMNQDDKKVEKFVENTETSTILEEVNMEKPIKYQTLHIPEPNAIDTFTIDPAEIIIDRTKVVLEMPKPYASAFVSGFDSSNNNGFAALWNGKWGLTFDQNWGGEPWAGEAGWGTFETYVPTGGETSTWLTVDVKEYIKVYRYRTGFYWPYMAHCPQISELWAYTGTGAPTAADGWNNWVKLGTIDNSYLTPELMKTQYGLGDNIYFDADDVPKARYYRLNCVKNWDNRADRSKIILCIAEMTFWAYAG